MNRVPDSRPRQAILAFEKLGPRSLTRLLGLFGILTHSCEGLTVGELSTALQSPKSSLVNLLKPLVAGGYLSHCNHRYRLGPATFRLANFILQSRERPVGEAIGAARRNGASLPQAPFS